MRQGRYRSKLVEDQRYLDQLLIYIHLNPVQAGLVDDPAKYRWSGHRELLGLSVDQLTCRGRASHLVQARELLLLVGVDEGKRTRPGASKDPQRDVAGTGTRSSAARRRR